MDIAYNLHNLLLASTESSGSPVVEDPFGVGPATNAVSDGVAPVAGPALSRIHFATSFANVILSSPGSA